VQIVQFEIPGRGRRVGWLEQGSVIDVTTRRPELTSVYDVFHAGLRAGTPFDEFLRGIAQGDRPAIDFEALAEAEPDSGRPFLHPPLDHPEPRRVLVTGTGLTHLGSMQSRDRMHAADRSASRDAASRDAAATTPSATDSARMFQWGLDGGRPETGRRGTAPEWFYKGDGGMLRGHRGMLEIPAFALDGGEEPEVVGCYAIDERGQPRRLGFALGNEWSDHATEKLNYLYLAPSKLRPCAVGPVLNTDGNFDDVPLRCTVLRGGQAIYDSGELHSGEAWMCHSLANLEDHHFKYAQHRRPGDVHLHFFGTSKLSYGARTWTFETGDEIRIEAPGFSPPLVNRVVRIPRSDQPCAPLERA
jgi:hypothetical protein